MVHNKNLFELKKKIKEVLELQKKKSIKSYAHVYVIAELLSHLADPRDPHFNECKKSILFLWDHCTDQKGKFNFITDYDSFFAKYYFNTNIRGSFESYDQFTQLCSYIYNNRDDHNLFDIRSDLLRISEAVDELEDKFIERNKKYIKYTDPNSQDWQLYKNEKDFRKRNLKYLSSQPAIDLIAKLEVRKIEKYAGQKLSPEDKNKFAKILKENFKLHFMMHINILKKTIISGCDFSKKKNANLFWDLEIASCVQTGNFRNPERFSLVTYDKAILEAAKDCVCRDRVLTFDEYNDYLYE